MRQVSVQEWTRRLPFVPFVVHCSDGVRYEVRHPELVIAALAHIAVTVPAADGDSPAVVLSYYHVVRIEPLRPPAGTTGNGQAPG